MSRRRRTCRTPWILVLVLAVALVAAALLLYRIYPEYQRLRSAEAAPGQDAVSPDQRPPSSPVVARLYFARIVDGKQRLVAISRELPSGLPPPEAALEELIRGDVPRECDRPLPRGTELREVRVLDGVAFADFSETLRSGFRGGSDNEGVMVYAIINTLAQLPGIEEVQVLVEGEKVNEIGGHLYMGDPLSFDDELVAPHP